jgi:hypothetical protein
VYISFYSTVHKINMERKVPSGVVDADPDPHRSALGRLAPDPDLGGQK